MMSLSRHNGWRAGARVHVDTDPGMGRRIPEMGTPAPESPPCPVSAALPVGKPFNRAQAGDALSRLGWGNAPFAHAVAGFQSGFALLGERLLVDGVYGPVTDAALRLSMSRLAAGTPTASVHFSFSEFACRCKGRCAGEPKAAVPTSRIWVRRDLLVALDRLRANHYPRGLTPESGCRCWEYHKALYKRLGKPVTTNSQHLYGAAADVPATVSTPTMRSLRAFSGIGWQASNGRVSHVDVRHASGHNTTGSTPTSPAVWQYA